MNSGYVYARGDIMPHYLLENGSLSDKPHFQRVYEDTSAYVLEDDLAQRWWSLPLGISLPLTGGNAYQLVFAGRRGGSSGPDVRDAVLGFSIAGTSFKSSCRQALSIVGDIEFHVRSSDWFTHRHHIDARYNNVILHVVLNCDDITPTRRQDGVVVPVCSLNDVPPMPHAPALAVTWPCQREMALMSDEERSRLLRQAGMLRFEQKMHAFVEQLRNAQAHEVFSAYDVCLISALAEGLGYGRDRDFFRAAGLRLLSLPGKTPEPLGHASAPPPLDAKRLRILGSLIEKWRVTGAWHTVRAALFSQSGDHSSSQVLRQMRALFAELSTGRADILICNIVLPFAAAVAELASDALLGEQAQKLYIEHPGLPSNSVTRGMCNQLQLEREPGGACQQQGLHYIYAQTCREKLCRQCMLGELGI